MPDVELSRREGVELVRTGRFQTLTGSWNPTPQDIRAAVEAMDCPAIRKPVIRLGHTDQRFVGDGEPALGWFENLRAADDGHTLFADQVTLPWLHSVQAAAYPSRSIEGNYNHLCSEGHRHKFVIHTVALLGVTPPGVQTLRSLNDLPDMLGVAASGEVPEGAEHVQVTIMARHRSADFDEHEHPRDGDGKFAHSRGEALPDTPKDTPKPSALKRDEKLAGRIPLGKGETYTGSTVIKSAGIAAATVDTPDGPTVRLGLGIDSADYNRWSGADKGSTVVLDEQGVGKLRSVISEMFDAAKQGKQMHAVLEKRERDLQLQEQTVLNRQYPNLSKAQAKDLAAAERRIIEIGNDLDWHGEHQQGRLSGIPDAKDRDRIVELDALIAQAMNDDKDAEPMRRERRRLLATEPTYGDITAMTYARTANRVLQLRNELGDVEARRAALTADPVPLSDGDQAELDRIRAAIATNTDLWGELENGQTIAEGEIPAGWGTIRWQTTMVGDNAVHDLVVASAAGDGQDLLDGGDGRIDAADLRKLAALLDKVAAPKPVQAAAGDDAGPVHTSAVVMLVPTAEDAERLAVEGGEPAGELHVTLAYLGDAAHLGEAGQQDVIDAVSTAVNGLPVVEAEIFSVAAFNPPNSSAADDGRDRTSCLVWGLSGDLIDAVHSVVEDALSAVDRPLQHRPWHAHITALISDDLAQIPVLAERVGPVTFDRVRMAFAGQHVDIPLIGPDVSASAEPETPLVLPAAEPEHEINPDPKEDLVSTDLSAFRSRLGLDDTADEQAILSALDALKTKADTPPVPEPTAEMVAASAAAVQQAEAAEAEKNELLTEVKVLASQVTAMSTKLAEAEKEKAAAAKVTVIQAAADQGKFTPADREQWEKDYDEAPGAVTRILASIAPGTAVPVVASGKTGPAEPQATDEFSASDEALADWAKSIGIDAKELTY